MHHIQDQIVLMALLKVWSKTNCECADVSICTLTINANVRLNHVEPSQLICKVHTLYENVCKNIWMWIVKLCNSDNLRVEYFMKISTCVDSMEVKSPEELNTLWKYLLV